MSSRLQPALLCVKLTLLDPFSDLMLCLLELGLVLAKCEFYGCDQGCLMQGAHGSCQHVFYMSAALRPATIDSKGPQDEYGLLGA